MENSEKALGERCEAATLEQQETVLDAVAVQLDWHRSLDPLAADFWRFHRARAFESAALTLVPKGWDLIRVESPRTGSVLCFLFNERTQETQRAAGKTIALAVAAASMRATYLERRRDLWPIP